MNKEEKERTADILTEKGRWIRVGALPIHIRPLTLGQIYEMGSVTSDLQSEGLSTDKKVNLVGEMLLRYEDARRLRKVFLICAFRSRWMRAFFGWYIRHRLTVLNFKELVDTIATGLDASFFLTSIIFLHQTTKMTEPSQTTVLGQQSEM